MWFSLEYLTFFWSKKTYTCFQRYCVYLETKCFWDRINLRNIIIIRSIINSLHAFCPHSTVIALPYISTKKWQNWTDGLPILYLLVSIWLWKTTIIQIFKPIVWCATKLAKTWKLLVLFSYWEFWPHSRIWFLIVFNCHVSRWFAEV